jgi:hypothetical protein
MTIQTFLKNLVISLQANTEKYRREQYKAKYRALRRRERTQGTSEKPRVLSGLR